MVTTWMEKEGWIKEWVYTYYNKSVRQQPWELYLDLLILSER